jgi:lipid II:glycine glycyltransferase (peptidoglycan interpeptide bridge formation enzyme)
MVNPSEEFVCDALNEVREYLIGKKTVAELIKLNPLFVDQNRLFCDQYYGSYEVMRKVVSVPVVKGASRLLSEEYKQENRKAVRRAIKAGVTIEITRNQETWDKFIELYKKTMEHNRADQKYQIGNEFANNIRVNLDKHYVLVAAKYERHLISVLLVLYDRVNAYCHLIGTEDKIELRKLQANNLLHHSACEWAHRQGLSELMIGGGRTDIDSDSLLRFKASFAKERKEFIACETVFDKNIYAEIMGSRNHRSRGQGLLFYRDSLV